LLPAGTLSAFRRILGERENGTARLEAAANAYEAALDLDVIEFPYTGNKLHPTQKPVAALKPLIEAFCPPQGTLLDPFADSGSSLVAARQLGRQCIGIELDEQHHHTATTRLQEAQPLSRLRPLRRPTAPAFTGRGQLRARQRKPRL
jgi:adenine-specific DNA-methyltransferase